MPIFCTSCGTLYGGWELCPECNADNPMLKKKDEPDFDTFNKTYVVRWRKEGPAQEPVTYKVEEGVSRGENTAQDADKVKVHPYFSGESRKC